MKELLELLTKSQKYETHIANLSQRLDFNGYYSKSLLKLDDGFNGSDVIDMH